MNLFHGRLQWWEHVIIHVPLNVLTPRVKYGLGVIMMGQGRWVSWDRQISLVGDSGSEEGCAYVGTGICGNCTFHSVFLLTSTTLENTIGFKKSIDHTRVGLALESQFYFVFC